MTIPDQDKLPYDYQPEELRDIELRTISEKCEQKAEELVAALPPCEPTAPPADTAETSLFKRKTTFPSLFKILVSASFLVVLAVGLFFAFSVSTSLSDQSKTFTPVIILPGLAAQEIPHEVIACLPFAAVACILISVAALYLMNSCKSRYIDWSDTHLFLEYSGPVTMAIKWSAIRLVQQSKRWDIIGGYKPVLLVTTNEGNKFQLRLADITKRNNIGAFFSHVKTGSSNVKIDVDQQFAQDHAYTELWLKYFSTPVTREKTGLLEPGMMVDNGRYRIVSTISGGGQGTAYLAVVERNIIGAQPEGSDTRLMVVPETERPHRGEQVVLKEYVLPVHRGHLTAERTSEQLKAEAEILNKLSHPNIVRLKDAFVEDYRGYLVMEYITGESLKSLVENQGPQSAELVTRWAIEICDILAYLHSFTPPVVHRDVTPDNLILQEDGSIKLVDFNVACQVDSTATATVVGKHAYISAEQFRGKPCPQSDIYSFGATLFYLLTGNQPEPITQSHPKEANPKVSEELDALVASCTSLALKTRMDCVARLKSKLVVLLESGTFSRQ